MTSFTQMWGVPTANASPNIGNMVHSVSSPALSQLSHSSSVSSNLNTSVESTIPFYCQNPACRKAIEMEDSLFSNLEIWMKSQDNTTSTLRPREDSNANSRADSNLEDIEQEQGQFKKWLEKSSSSSSNLSSSLTPTLKTSKSWISGAKEQYVKFQEIFSRLSDWLEPTNLELPLCGECAQKILKTLEKDLSLIKAQKVTIDRSFQKYSEIFSQTLQESFLDSQLQIAEEEEAKLLAELTCLDSQLKIVAQEAQVLDQYHLQIQKLENQHFEFDKFMKTDIKDFLDESDTYIHKASELKSKLYVLGSTNVLNDCFHIWFEGHFGTINGLRLGTLSSQPVDWNEINAAWGYVILLLDLLSKNLQFQFPSFELVPMGSFSKIQRKNDGSIFELFGNNDFMLGKWFWARRYETAMTGVLTCIKDLSELFQHKQNTFQLPFRIEKDKIHGYSIKYQFSDEETWTKALKYLLANLKYIVAWFVKSQLATCK